MQTQTEHVLASGVVFTRDIQRNRPYYLVNYDDNGSTDLVTSGSGGKSLWMSRDISAQAVPAPWQGLLAAVREIERVLDGMILDIEFAITQGGQVVIFQVRPLAANYRFSKEFDDQAFFSYKQQVRETVATEFVRDMNRYLAGELPRDIFCERYGHLRSGTYDIRADRYDQLSFRAEPGRQLEEPAAAASVSLPEAALQQALDEAGFSGITPGELVRFMRTALEQRERFKFEFTKSLSLALEVLRMAGRNLGIPVEELSYLQVADILAAEYYGSGEELQAFWKALIQRRQELRGREGYLALPDVLTGVEDIDFVSVQEARPNFITEKAATGEIVTPEEMGAGGLAGRIVLLEKADPGFDWIFPQGIAGLITCYGGAASHMAIRCAEFGIPAAIGCGKKIYAQVGGMKRVTLDAKGGRITEVKG